jgi:hypothetical protein
MIHGYFVLVRTCAVVLVYAETHRTGTLVELKRQAQSPVCQHGTDALSVNEHSGDEVTGLWGSQGNTR